MKRILGLAASARRDGNSDRLLDRVQAVGALGRAPAPARQTFRFLSLESAGHLRWGKVLSMRPPLGQPRVTISFLVSSSRFPRFLAMVDGVLKKYHQILL